MKMTKENEKKAIQQAALLEAARQGDYQQLESILGQVQQLKARKKKSNPLASLRKSVSLNRVRDPVTGFTCLHHAALNGHTKCVQLILDCGAKLNALDYKGSSALHLAAWVGNLDVIRLLLQRRPPSIVHQQYTSSMVTGCETTGSPLNSDLVVDVNLCNNDNQTPLSLAAQFGHLLVARELLQHGARLDLRSHQLDSPLDLASLNGRLEMVDLLLENSPRLVAELHQSQAVITLNCNLERGHHQRSGVDTSPNDAQQRPSGWSSLLTRGRRESTPTGKSPLQRLTIGTLSMRQPAASTGRKYTDTPESPMLRNLETAKRRATLTSGINSFDQIYPANRSSVNSHISQVHRASLSIYQDANFSEILLDHSPLHYAARKGHSNVLALLFNKYQANVLQVTSLGGILHELALNNYTRHIDVLKLVFKYISKKSNCLGVLSALLELQDSHGQTVFDILKAMNNKSALEMTRSIQECSDQLRAVYSAHQTNIIQHYGTLAHPPRGGGTGRPSYTSQTSDAEQQFASLRRKRPPLVESQQINFQTSHIYPVAESNRYRHQQSTTSDSREGQENSGAFVMARSVSNLNRVSSFQHRQPSREHSQPMDEPRMQRASRHCIDTGSDIADSGIESEIIKQPTGKVNSKMMGQAAQMVRSQTDCSHLFKTSKPHGENCNEQRTTINRGYHVYEHEFYPPRLFPGGRNFSTGVSSGNDELRQTTSLDISSTGSTSNRLLLEQTTGDNRLSLNTAISPMYQQQAYPRQQHKIQKPTNLVIQSGLEGQTLKKSNSNLNNSHSYDGHLGSHMFESARQAIMRDFDKMIGKELLNRNHCDIIKGVQAAQPNPHHQKESMLQLSKVHLDMDKQGDRLTVSGLMTVTPPTIGKPPRAPAASSSLPPMAGVRTTSQTTRTSTCPNQEMAHREDVAPAKPPRLSLLNRNPILSTSCNPPSEHQQPTSAPTKVPSTEINNNNKPPRQQLQQLLQILPHQQHHSAHDSKTNLESGLLKVASPSGDIAQPVISLQRTGIAAETDSGMCTSNSPVSLTTTATPDTTQTTTSLTNNQQQRSAVVRHLARPQMPMLSFNQNHHQTLESSPPSPNTAQHCIEEVLQMQQQPNRSSGSISDKSGPPCSLESWFLDRNCHSHNRDDANYENCIDLQNQIKRCSSIACLMVPPKSSSPSSNSDNQRQTESALSSDAGTTSHADDEVDDDDYASSSNQSSKNFCSDSCNSSSEDQLPMKQEKKCKQLLLRVIIDENEVHTNYGELFYMNPSELKKIAVKRPQADAETITDEELCATLDEQSGCIRFSLRKRCDIDKRSEGTSLPSPATIDDSSSISSKKSRLSIQQVSEHHPPPEPNNNNASHEPSIALACTPVQPQEVNNKHKCYDKQAAIGLEKWFMSTNLVGLVEYSPKFVENGYDSIRFLNHPRLMNEDCLSRMGIKDESHQLLILEKVRSDLNPVDFNTIFPKDALETLNLEKFLQSIQLIHLQPLVQAINCDNWKDAVIKITDSLPDGTRGRIIEALKHITDTEKQELSPSSQASASSSSSKYSIKSIVSKQSTCVAPQTVAVTAATIPDEVANSHTVNIQSQSKVLPPKLEISKSLVSIKAQLRPVAAARRSSNIKPETNDSPTKTAAHMSVKSVCWPPKSNGQLWSANSPVESTKSIQNVNQQAPITSHNNKSKPIKPAPPAKPLKLVAPNPRLMNQTYSSSS